MENRDRQQPDKTISSDHVASIPVVKETIRLDSKVVEKGTVRVTKRVEEETVRVPLLTQEDEYHIERVAINQYVEEPPPPVRHEGDTMIIPVVIEELVVEKRLKIVEEVRITRSTKETAWEAETIVRKENVTVERQSAQFKNQS